MSPQTLGKIEREYKLSNPPCGRCKDCVDKPTCRTVAFAQGGTVVTLSMDKGMHADQVDANLHDTIFNLLDLSIPRGTVVNLSVKHQSISTVCLADQLVKLQPHK